MRLFLGPCELIHIHCLIYQCPETKKKEKKKKVLLNQSDQSKVLKKTL